MSLKDDVQSIIDSAQRMANNAIETSRQIYADAGGSSNTDYSSQANDYYQSGGSSERDYSNYSNSDYSYNNSSSQSSISDYYGSINNNPQPSSSNFSNSYEEPLKYTSAFEPTKSTYNFLQTPESQGYTQDSSGKLKSSFESPLSSSATNSLKITSAFDPISSMNKQISYDTKNNSAFNSDSFYNGLYNNQGATNFLNQNTVGFNAGLAHDALRSESPLQFKPSAFEQGLNTIGSAFGSIGNAISSGWNWVKNNALTMPTSSPYTGLQQTNTDPRFSNNATINPETRSIGGSIPMSGFDSNAINPRSYVPLSDWTPEYARQKNYNNLSFSIMDSTLSNQMTPAEKDNLQKAFNISTEAGYNYQNQLKPILAQRRDDNQNFLERIGGGALNTIQTSADYLRNHFPSILFSKTEGPLNTQDFNWKTGQIKTIEEPLVLKNLAKGIYDVNRSGIDALNYNADVLARNIYANELQKKRNTNGFLGKVETAAQSIVEQTPSLLLGVITANPLLAGATMGVQSAGLYGADARLQGASIEQANIKAVLGGTWEAVSGTILGRTLKMINPSFDKTVYDTATKNLASNLARVFKDFAKPALFEGVEEALTDPVMNAIDKATFNKDMPWFGKGGVVNFDQMYYSGLVGTLTGTALGTTNIPHSIKEATNAKKYIDLNYNGAVTAGQAMPVDSKAYEMSVDLLRKGDKVTAEDVRNTISEIKNEVGSDRDFSSLTILKQKGLKEIKVDSATLNSFDQMQEKAKQQIEIATGTRIEGDAFQIVGGNAEHKAITQIGQAIGTNVLIINPLHKEADFGNGMFFTDDSGKSTIYLSSRAKNPLMTVLGHEVGHQMELVDPNAYNKLQEIFKNELDNTASMGYRKIYEEKHARIFKQEMSDTEYYKEALSDYMGEEFVNPQFWAKVIQNDQSFSKKIIDILRNILKKIKGIIHPNTKVKQYINDINKVQSAYLNAFNQFVKTNREQSTLKMPQDQQQLIPIKTKKPEYNFATDEYLKSIDAIETTTNNVEEPLDTKTIEPIINETKEKTKWNTTPQTETDEFKKWFGNSVIKTSDGNPQVVFRQMAIDKNSSFLAKLKSKGIFGKGLYFTTEPDVANIVNSTNRKYAQGTTTVPVYLKMENPFRISYKNKDEFITKMETLTKKKQTIFDVLNSKGYDGLIMINDDGTMLYMVGDYNQVKSAIGNVGTFDSNTKNISYSLKEEDDYVPALYSQLEKVIETKMGGRANPLELLNLIKKSGVKADELQWTGIEDWLKQMQNKPVTKQEVQEYLALNNINLKVINNNHYIDYKEDNGKQYNELLFIMPDLTEMKLKNISNELSKYKTIKAKQTGLDEESFELSEILNNDERYKKLKAELRTTFQRSPKYVGKHYDGKENILAFTRYQTFYDQNEKAILFIEEIQSDWHQDAIEKGYKKNYKELPEGYHVELRDTIPFTGPNAGKPEPHWYVIGPDNDIVQGSNYSESQAITNALYELNKDGVPEAPYKSNWDEFVIRRLLRLAAEQGFDKIAFTTGDRQFKRWGTERIHWKKSNDGYWLVTAQSQYRGEFQGRPLEEIAQEHNMYFEHDNTKIKEKDDLWPILNDIMESDKPKHKEKTLEKLWAKMQQEDSGIMMPRKEGLDYFYDNRILNYIRKYTKKWNSNLHNETLYSRTDSEYTNEYMYNGPEVEAYEIDNYIQSEPTASIEKQIYKLVADNGYTFGEALEQVYKDDVVNLDVGDDISSYEEIKRENLYSIYAIAEHFGGTFSSEKKLNVAYMTERLNNIPVIDITPEMKKSVLYEGQPKYSIKDDLDKNIFRLPKRFATESEKVKAYDKAHFTWIDQTYKNISDDYFALDKFMNVIKPEQASEDTYKLAMNSKNARVISKYIFTKALVNREGKKIGESFRSIMADISKKRMNDFNYYKLLQHHIDRMSLPEPKPVLGKLTINEAMEQLKELNEKHLDFQGIADRFDKWMDTFMREWMVKSGLLSQEAYDRMHSLYPHYVPTHRIFKTKGKPDFVKVPKFLNKTSGIKKATGSDLPIINPMDNTMRIIDRTLKTAKFNEVGVSIVEAIREQPELAKPFANIVKRTATKKELDMQSNGIEGYIDDAYTQYESAYQLWKTPNSFNELYVLVDGKKVELEINSQPFLDAVTALEYAEPTGIMKAIKYLQDLRKLVLVRANPFFAVRNFARDLPTAFIQGEEDNPAKFLFGLFRSAGELALNTDKAKQYKAIGGGGFNYVANDSKKLITRSPSKLNPLHWFETFNNYIENIPRYNEFRLTHDKLTALGIDNYAALQQALYNAGEVTVNFSRSGKWLRDLEILFLYLNATVQGLDKFTRTFKDRPIATILKSMSAVTLPSFLLYLVNSNDEDYKKLKDRDKDANMLIPVGKLGVVMRDSIKEVFGVNSPFLTEDGKFIKIPKNREFGVVFGAVAERVFRWLSGDKNAFAGLLTEFKNNFLPNNPIDSNLAAPLIQAMRNRDFANRYIVPKIFEGVKPEKQYDENTSELAKWFGRVTGMSPMQVDFVLNAYGGVIMDVVQPLTTKNQSLVDMLSRQFIIDSRYSNTNLDRFYDELNKLRGKETELKMDDMQLDNTEVQKLKKLKAVSYVLTDLFDQIGKTNDKQKQIALRDQINFLSVKAVNDMKLDTPFVVPQLNLFEGKWTINGKDYKLTPDEYNKYQRILENTLIDSYRMIYKDQRMDELKTDKDKLKVIENLITDGQGMVKNLYAADHGIEVKKEKTEDEKQVAKIQGQLRDIYNIKNDNMYTYGNHVYYIPESDPTFEKVAELENNNISRERSLSVIQGLEALSPQLGTNFIPSLDKRQFIETLSGFTPAEKGLLNDIMIYKSNLEALGSNSKISTEQSKRIYAIAKANGIDLQTVMQKYGYSGNTQNILKADYNIISDELELMGKGIPITSNMSAAFDYRSLLGDELAQREQAKLQELGSEYKIVENGYTRFAGNNTTGKTDETTTPYVSPYKKKSYTPYYKKYYTPYYKKSYGYSKTYYPRYSSYKKSYGSSYSKSSYSKYNNYKQSAFGYTSNLSSNPRKSNFYDNLKKDQKLFGDVKATHVSGMAKSLNVKIPYRKYSRGNLVTFEDAKKIYKAAKNNKSIISKAIGKYKYNKITDVRLADLPKILQDINRLFSRKRISPKQPVTAKPMKKFTWKKKAI